MYEVASVLASAGLTLKDVDAKNLAFSQMAAAMANGALDAAMEVAPFTDRIVEQKIGVRWIDPDDYIHPLPMTSVGYIVNTDWARGHETRPTNCLSRSSAPAATIAKPIITGRTAPRSSTSFSRTASAPIAICSTAWPGRRAIRTAQFNVASLVDMQAFFQRSGVIEKTSPAEKLVDPSYAAAAAKALGPFELINKASPLKGCR